MSLEVWITFLIAALLISLSPGAGAINTMSSGVRYGTLRSLPSILGLQLGFAIQILLVGIGLGALIASSATAFSIIKWTGVFYLIWLGYSKFRETTQPLSADLTPEESSRTRFLKAVLVNLTNPKATVFLIALFPQFINPEIPDQSQQMLIMGSTLILVDTCVMIGYATLAAGMTRWFKSEKHLRLQNRLFGSLFMGAAMMMAAFQGNR